MLGALLQGMAVSDRAYAGGWWDWLTPFSLLTGVSVAIAYALLGATWLVMKAEGRAAAARPGPWPGGWAAPRWPPSSWSASPRLFLSADYFANWLHWPEHALGGAGAHAGGAGQRGLRAQPEGGP